VKRLTHGLFSFELKMADLHVVIDADSDDNAATAIAEYQGSVNVRVGGCSLLFTAVVRGAPKCVAALLRAGANPQVESSGGYLPLAQAVRCNNLPVLRALLAGRTDVNALEFGWSALFWAAYENRPDAAALLIQAGADTQARDNIGRTAEEVAQQQQHADVVRVIRVEVRFRFRYVFVHVQHAALCQDRDPAPASAVPHAHHRHTPTTCRYFRVGAARYLGLRCRRRSAVLSRCVRCLHS
jgi:hypothetical protein